MTSTPKEPNTPEDELLAVVTEAAEAIGGRVATDEEFAGILAVMEASVAEGDAKARAEGRRFLDEETDRDVIDGWYAEAKNCETLEQATDLMRRLLADYRHDYGTIVHASTAAALAAVHVVSENELTGFQAGCLFWEFSRRWMQWGDEPRKLTDYSQLLYPQDDHYFNEISSKTAEWLTAKAESLIAENGDRAHPDVVRRWRDVAAGTLPPFIQIEAS